MTKKLSALQGPFWGVRMDHKVPHLSGAPGFLFSEKEWLDAVTLFSFSASCMWKCYLWGEREQLTLFNWEGEIFDVWPGSEKGRKALLELLKNFNLKRIIRRSKNRSK